MKQLCLRKIFSGKLLWVLAPLLGLLAVAGQAAEVAAINGTGATLPYPVYASWASGYYRETGIKVNYQAIGSGAGIKQIKARTVDFGASDEPLSPQELADAGLLQFPMVMGGVVPVMNLRGIGAGALQLDGTTLAQIFLGRITRWNDPRIGKLNPDLTLPDRRITVVHRSDGAGTTFVFTDYLSRVSEAWRETVGVAKAVAWPAGVGSKGNQGVAAYVQRIDGAIGYIEYAYVQQLGMSYVRLKNRAGRFVTPGPRTFRAAAADVDWARVPAFDADLINTRGENSWPIVGASFILVPLRPTRPKRLRGVLRFFDWCYREGDPVAAALGYVSMPQSVARRARKAWATRIVAPDGGAIWPPPDKSADALSSLDAGEVAAGGNISLGLTAHRNRASTVIQ